jgi:hypothetical protein
MSRGWVQTRRVRSCSVRHNALIRKFIGPVLLVPMTPGRALASVHMDKLDIATDIIGHFGRRPDISDMAVGARMQTLVARRTFAKPS